MGQSKFNNDQRAHVLDAEKQRMVMDFTYPLEKRWTVHIRNWDEKYMWCGGSTHQLQLLLIFFHEKESTVVAQWVDSSYIISCFHSIYTLQHQLYPVRASQNPSQGRVVGLDQTLCLYFWILCGGCCNLQLFLLSFLAQSQIKTIGLNSSHVSTQIKWLSVGEMAIAIF